MGAFFTRFIQEHFDPDGRLERYTYTYDDNFNYGYDVVDQLGALYPDRPAMLWRNDQGAATGSQRRTSITVSTRPR